MREPGSASPLSFARNLPSVMRAADARAAPLANPGHVVLHERRSRRPGGARVRAHPLSNQESLRSAVALVFQAAQQVRRAVRGWVLREQRTRREGVVRLPAATRFRLLATSQRTWMRLPHAGAQAEPSLANASSHELPRPTRQSAANVMEARAIPPFPYSAANALVYNSVPAQSASDDPQGSRRARFRDGRPQTRVRM